MGKKVLAVAAVACMVVGSGVASASGAQFTASELGSLSSEALTSQSFTTNSGTWHCTEAAISGELSRPIAAELKMAVQYGGCTFFGFAQVEYSPAHYSYSATGELTVLEPFTMKVPLAGCSITFPKQVVKSASYSNTGSKLKLTNSISKTEYVSSGGLCGTSGKNGTFVAGDELERVGGGFLSFDP